MWDLCGAVQSMQWDLMGRWSGCCWCQFLWVTPSVRRFHWGKKQGYGVYSWPDGSLYMGQWDSNAINGYGHYMGKDGREPLGTDRPISKWQKWNESKFKRYWKSTAFSLTMVLLEFVYEDVDHFFNFCRFQGLWHEAVIHGCGRYTWPDGRTCPESSFASAILLSNILAINVWQMVLTKISRVISVISQYLT